MAAQSLSLDGLVLTAGQKPKTGSADRTLVQRAGQRSDWTQMVEQTKALNVCRILMVQKVDQKPALSLKAGQTLTCFADLGPTFVVGPA